MLSCARPRLLSDPSRRPRLLVVEVHPYAWSDAAAEGNRILTLLRECGYEAPRDLDVVPWRHSTHMGTLSAGHGVGSCLIARLETPCRRPEVQQLVLLGWRRAHAACSDDPRRVPVTGYMAVLNKGTPWCVLWSVHQLRPVPARVLV